MPTKISSLNEFQAEYDDSSNFYALGYNEADDGTKTNYRINLKDLIEKAIENVDKQVDSLNKLLSEFSKDETIKTFLESNDNTNKGEVTQVVSKLIEKISNLNDSSNTTDVSDLKTYKENIETESVNLANLLNGTNKDEISIITELGNLLNLIINKTQYLEANIGTGSDDSGGQINTDTSDLENRIENVEIAIGLNEETGTSSIPEFPTYPKDQVPSDLEIYNDAATKFNSDLITYQSDDAAIINKSKANEYINNIINEENNIAEYFPITTVSEISNDVIADTNGDISYTVVDDKISSINASISIIKTLNENIKKFNSEKGEEGEYISSLNEVEATIKDLEEQGESIYTDVDNLKNLLTNIKDDYDFIQNKLKDESVSSKWSNVVESIEGIDDLIDALENSEILDTIKGKFDKVKPIIDEIFTNTQHDENNTIFAVVSIVETNIKNIDDYLNSLEQLKITVDKVVLAQNLLKNYNEIKSQFEDLTKPVLSETKNNEAITAINDALSKSSDYYDSTALSATYINNEIINANEIYKYGFDKEEEITQYIECIKNIYKSKSFVKSKDNIDDFNKFFDDLEKYSNYYNCYWKDTDTNTISDKLIEISEVLNDFILIAFISKFENGKYLESKILESADTISENITSEIEVIKNNLIKISENVTNESAVGEEDFKEVKTNIEEVTTNIEDLQNKVTNEIPARINIETNKVRESLEEKIIQQTNDLTNFKNNIQNYNGFISFNTAPEEITVSTSGEALPLNEQNYYKLEVTDSGILYIIKGESTNIKFIPYTKDGDNTLSINDFYKNLYCSEEGLNVPFITIPILKNNGILLPEGFTEKFYFIPYLTVTEIDNIIKA